MCDRDKYGPMTLFCIQHFNSSTKMLELTGPSYSHALISHSRVWATSNVGTEKTVLQKSQGA